MAILDNISLPLRGKSSFLFELDAALAVELGGCESAVVEGAAKETVLAVEVIKPANCNTESSYTFCAPMQGGTSVILYPDVFKTSNDF
jgi:hypothetical protein